jgi:hypothetical protein
LIRISVAFHGTNHDSHDLERLCRRALEADALCAIAPGHTSGITGHFNPGEFTMPAKSKAPNKAAGAALSAKRDKSGAG